MAKRGLPWHEPMMYAARLTGMELSDDDLATIDPLMVPEVVADLRVAARKLTQWAQRLEPGMDRRELDVIALQLIAAADDADAIAASVPPSQVRPTIRRLYRASRTIGRTMRVLEAKTGAPVFDDPSCERCHDSFTAMRSDARYCSSRCRVAAHRERVTAVTPVA